MTRWVDQTTFGFPGGNCFSACVASLLGLDLAAVPYFMDDEDKWWDFFSSWLRPHGMWAVCFELKRDGWVPEGLHILSGTSPRAEKPEDKHSVVADGRRIVHDPHPSRAGLASRDDVILLIPLDPWKEPA